MRRGQERLDELRAVAEGVERLGEAPLLQRRGIRTGRGSSSGARGTFRPDRRLRLPEVALGRAEVVRHQGVAGPPDNGHGVEVAQTVAGGERVRLVELVAMLLTAPSHHAFHGEEREPRVALALGISAVLEGGD